MTRLAFIYIARGILLAWVGLSAACGFGHGYGDPTPAALCGRDGFSLVSEELLGSEDIPYDLSQYGQYVSGFGIAAGDLSGDGAPDLLYAFPFDRSYVFLNNGRGQLAETTSITVDGGPFPIATSVAMADVDGDGDLDVFMGASAQEPDRLLRNEGGGRFVTEVLDHTGDLTNTGTFADLDGDGDLDLYSARTLFRLNVEEIDTWSTELATDAVYMNEGGRLVYDAERVEPELAGALAFEAIFFDYDGDGDLDKLLTHDFGMYVTPNTFSVNDGTGHFALQGGTGMERAMFGMGAARGDVNDDGALDFFVTNIGTPALFMADGEGGYYDGARAEGVSIAPSEERLVSWGSAFVDANLDTYLDLAVVFGTLTGDVTVLEEVSEAEGETWVDSYTQRDALFMGSGASGFAEVSAASGFDHDGVGRSIIQADLDLDGTPEILTAGKDFVRVWRPEGACGGSIALVFGPNPANVHGIGARVEVTSGGRTFTRWHLPGSTFSSSVPNELYIGIGAAEAASLTVTWLSGETRHFEGVGPGTRLRVSP